jgi:hypothetical protein
MARRIQARIDYSENTEKYQARNSKKRRKHAAILLEQRRPVKQDGGTLL